MEPSFTVTNYCFLKNGDHLYIQVWGISIQGRNIKEITHGKDLSRNPIKLNFLTRNTSSETLRDAISRDVPGARRLHTPTLGFDTQPLPWRPAFPTSSFGCHRLCSLGG